MFNQTSTPTERQGKHTVYLENSITEGRVNISLENSINEGRVNISLENCLTKRKSKHIFREQYITV